MTIEELAEVARLADDKTLMFPPWRDIALAVARRVLEEAMQRVRLAKHGEIAAANIAMMLGELTRSAT